MDVFWSQNKWITLATLAGIIVTSLNSTPSFAVLIPRKLHWVWMGKEMPERYVANIRTFVARNPDYEINIWMDKKMNFEKPLALADSGKFPYVLRDFNEVFPIMNPRLRAQFERERSGVFPNYAAASDILRVHILEEGGIYVDTDTSFDGLSRAASDEADKLLIERFLQKGDTARVETMEVAKMITKHYLCQDYLEGKLGEIDAPFGFLVHYNSKRPVFHSDGTMGYRWEINNNVMASVPHSSFLEALRMNMLRRYEESDPETIWQKKRFEPQQGSLRYEQTLHLSGPGVVYFILHNVSNSFIISPEDSLWTTFFGPGVHADLLKNRNILTSLLDQRATFTFLEPARADSTCVEPVRIMLDARKLEAFLNLFAFKSDAFIYECDLTWTQNKIDLNKLSPAEFHELAK